MVLPYFVAYTAAMSRAVTADRPAVHRPRPPRRGGGGCRWLLLRHGHGQRSGGELAAGSATPTELPFTGLNNPGGVAVDAASNVYVTDNGNNRVVKLAAG